QRLRDTMRGYDPNVVEGPLGAGNVARQRANLEYEAALKQAGGDPQRALEIYRGKQMLEAMPPPSDPRMLHASGGRAGHASGGPPQYPQPNQPALQSGNPMPAGMPAQAPAPMAAPAPQPSWAAPPVNVAQQPQPPPQPAAPMPQMPQMPST